MVSICQLEIGVKHNPECVASNVVSENSRLGGQHWNGNRRAQRAVVHHLHHSAGFAGQLPGHLKIDLLLAIHVVYGEYWRVQRVVDLHRSIQQLRGQRKSGGLVDALTGGQVRSEQRRHAAGNQAARYETGGVDDAARPVADLRTGGSKLANALVAAVGNPDIAARADRDIVGIVEIGRVGGAAVAGKADGIGAGDGRDYAERVHHADHVVVVIGDVEVSGAVRRHAGRPV